MKHQFIVEAECDGRFASKEGQEILQEMIAGRVWEMQHIVNGSACVKTVDKNCVIIISKIEYEQLKAAKQHLENWGS